MSNYMPRRTLARAIYTKFHNDSLLQNIDTTTWYTLNQTLPDRYQRKFVPLEKPDLTTLQWLDRAKMLSANIWMHLWHALARTILQYFMTQTDINGFLKRGSMFILSEEQFKRLLLAGGLYIGDKNAINILDIGAGDGEISLRLMNSVSAISENLNVQVYATEASWIMRERLKKHNFNVIDDSISKIRNIELISCLNVLDRCIDPFELLEDMHKSLSPNGRILLALVLPYMHYVENNTTHMPLRLLINHSNSGRGKQLSFEEEATVFFDLLQSMGFRVEAWTKAPYLCEGDLHQSFYWLTDIIVVLSKV